MKRFCLATCLIATAPCAFATGEYMDAFLSHYKLKENTAFNDKSCGICHVSDADFEFNPYGAAVKKALSDSGASAVDGAVLASIESLDSDGDGVTNGEEVAAATFPGDATSGAKAATATTSGGAGGPEVNDEGKDLEEGKNAAKETAFPPKNGFHPAIVHFPIALFIGGLILDFFGMVRKNRTLLAAGWYCIIMAAISAVGAILSGVAAMTLSKMPYRGLIFEHILFAVGAAVLMWIMVALRVDRHEQMNVKLRMVYYVLATGCLFLISYAGHLGGVFVYGE